MKHFSPDLNLTGRFLRALLPFALLIGVFPSRSLPVLAFAPEAARLFVGFEAYKGWYALRVYGKGQTDAGEMVPCSGTAVQNAA